MRKSAVLFALISLLAVAVHADPSVSLQTDAAPREITIGDRIAYRVTVTVSSDVMVAPFAPPVPFGEFETLMISSPVASVEGGSNKVRFVTDAILTTFSTGTVTIPPIVIPISTLYGSSSSITTEAIAINVKSMLALKGDEGHLRPLKGLFSFKSYAWIWWLTAIVVALIIGVLLWKKRATGSILGLAAVGPKKPPEEIAWEALHKLEDSDLLATGQHKEFYFQLSVILRRYLEDRYGMSALDKTTSELLMEFRRASLASELVALARTFLDNSDLVKFAKLIPLEPEIVDDVTRVKQFINVSTPQKLEKPEKPQEEKLPL